MNGRSRSIVLAAVVLALVVATTGCGSKKKSSAPPVDTTTTAAAATTTTAQTTTEAAYDDLELVGALVDRDRRQLQAADRSGADLQQGVHRRSERRFPEARRPVEGVRRQDAVRHPARLPGARGDVREVRGRAQGHQPQGRAGPGCRGAGEAAAAHDLDRSEVRHEGERRHRGVGAEELHEGLTLVTAVVPHAAAADGEEFPAWSLPKLAANRIAIDNPLPERVDREWALGGATGKGVKVCVLDSGVELTIRWSGRSPGRSRSRSTRTATRSQPRTPREISAVTAPRARA